MRLACIHQTKHSSDDDLLISTVMQGAPGAILCDAKNDRANQKNKVKNERGHVAPFQVLEAARC